MSWTGLPEKIDNDIQLAANEVIKLNNYKPAFEFISRHSKDLEEREAAIFNINRLVAKHTTPTQCGRRDGVMMMLIEVYNKLKGGAYASGTRG